MIVLTAGVDVQDDRFEVEVLGHDRVGRGSRKWCRASGEQRLAQRAPNA